MRTTLLKARKIDFERVRGARLLTLAHMVWGGQGQGTSGGAGVGIKKL